MHLPPGVFREGSWGGLLSDDDDDVDKDVDDCVDGLYTAQGKVRLYVGVSKHKANQDLTQECASLPGSVQTTEVSV